MARNITRDEFIQIFGMQPEEYRKLHPDRFKPAQEPKTTPKQARRYGAKSLTDDPEVQAAARPMVVAQDDAVEENEQDIPEYKSNARRFAEERGLELNAFERAIDAVNAPLEQGQKNVIAGVLALPSSVAGVVDLARFGAPAVARGIMSDKEGSITDRIGEEFMNSILPEEAIERLGAVQLDAVERFKKENPQATPEDIAKFSKWYTGSDEFYNKTLEELPAGLRIAQQGQNWANEAVGLGRRADQMSAGDEAMQILGSAGVGLPSSAVSKLSRPVVKAIGERVANHLATRAAVRVAEAVTPATLPLTPGNVAVNAGVGVAVNETIRQLQGQDTLIDYDQIYNPETLPDPEQGAAAAGLAAGMFLGLPGVVKNVTARINNAAKNTLKNIGQSAGPTLEDQSGRLTPQLSPATGLVDQNAPAKKLAQKFKDPNDTTSVPYIDAVASSGSHVNSVETTNNALNYGLLDGLGRNTVPYRELHSIYNRLDPATKDVLDKYVYATQRKQDSAAYEQSLIKQVRQAQANLQAAQLSGHKGRINKARNEFTDVQQKYRALQADDPSSRSSMVGWSRADVNRFIADGDARPEVKQIGDAIRKISEDLTDYLHANGIIDAAEAASRKSSRELYVPLRERKYPEATGIKRKALLLKDRLTPRFASDQGVFVNTAPRNITGEGAHVNQPKTAMVALQEGIMDAVRSVTANNTRREIIDTIAAMPGAKGVALRPYEFKIGNGRTTHSISPEQYSVLYPKGISDEDKYVKIFRNGKIELWEASDQSLVNALKFAPSAYVPLMNGMRKTFQQMTTGLAAPWFAVRSFMWDAPLAQTTKNAGRSLGMVDTLARRLADGSALERPVNELFDRVGSPLAVDAMVSAGAAIPYQLALRAARAVGDKIAIDLATNSGVFNAIAKSGPQGQKYVQQIGTFMATAFDKSALGVMSRNMSTSLSHLNDAAKIADDYANAATNSQGVVRATLLGMKAMMESIHMSTRTAFFASNYGRLRAKYKGNIPEKEIQKLVQETRNLTGDMTRQSNSRFIQGLNSVIPYSNATMQGTRHILTSAFTNQDTRFWSQITTSMVIPIMASSTMLSSWPGADDYWNNRTPKWKQMSHIPMPNAEAMIYRAENGEWPKFEEKYLNEIPIPPEFMLFTEPFKAGMRAAGLMQAPQYAVPQTYTQQIRDVMEQITNFATPPIAQFVAAWNGGRLDAHALITGNGAVRPSNPIPGGGANADMMTANSDISKSMYDMTGAIAGSAGQLAAQSLNVYQISRDEGASFTEALGAALDTAWYEATRRTPAITVPGLFDARTQLYQSTPESEYVYRTEDELEPIIGSGRQMSVERDSSGRNELQQALGHDAANKIRDPNLKALSGMVYDRLNRKGPYKEAKEASTSMRHLLASLESSRYRIPDKEYAEKRNNIIRQIQVNTRVQSTELQTLERQLQKTVGRRFLQQYGVPFSYGALSELVRKDVAQ